MNFLKQNWIFVFLILLLVGGVYYGLNLDVEQNDQPGTGSKTATTSRQAEVKEFAENYNATTEWAAAPFTFQIQEDLEGSNPLLLEGNIDDIYKDEAGYVVQLSSITSESPDYFASLRCAENVFDSVLEKHSESERLAEFDEYAVAAQVEKIEKPQVVIQGIEDSDSIYTKIENSNTLLLKGECLAIKHVGSFFDSF